jgi:hypothetical protein
MDAFTQDWAGVLNWIVPPIYLVIKTIFHLLYCGAHVTLKVLKWPVLVDKNGFKREFILDILEFN